MGVSFFKNMFVKETPLELLIEHAKILEDIANLTFDLINDYFEGKEIKEKIKQISDLESQGDKLKFDIRKVVGKNYKMPYSATAFLNYLNNQEKLIDLFEDVAKKLSLNRLEFTDKQVLEKFLKLVIQSKKAVDFLQEMILELKKVLDTSFAKKYIKKEKKDRIKVETIEAEADDISLELGKWIYANKNKENPIDLMFFRELILLFVRITDVAENTAEVLYAFINK